MYMPRREKILVMDFKETVAKNDCAGEGQQQFNRPTAVNDGFLVSIRI
jgi:hypothetical protein